MKCDELKVYVPQDGSYGLEPEEGGEPVEEETCYLKSDVDAAIAELKAAHHKERHEYIKMIAELKQKLEDAKATAYAESVDAGMRERRLKRALWLARAERAHSIILLWNVYCYQNNSLYFRDFMNEKCNPFRNLPKKTAMEWHDLWETIEIKCRAKAKEYK